MVQGLAPPFDPRIVCPLATNGNLHDSLRNQGPFDGSAAFGAILAELAADRCSGRHGFTKLARSLEASRTQVMAFLKGLLSRPPDRASRGILKPPWSSKLVSSSSDDCWTAHRARSGDGWRFHFGTNGLVGDDRWPAVSLH